MSLMTASMKFIPLSPEPDLAIRRDEPLFQRFKKVAIR
jgi:hypothetical protein